MKKIITMTKKEINVFIENDYPTFEFPQDIQLDELVQCSISMTKYFLQKKDWVKKSCLSEYDFEMLYFDIVLTDNIKIHEINFEYRQKDSATDVITFALFADSPVNERFVFDNEINLGEILISLDYTKEQVNLQTHEQKTFKDELLFLIAHGILHLLGYDHKDEQTLQEMWLIQQEMIKG